MTPTDTIEYDLPAILANADLRRRQTARDLANEHVVRLHPSGRTYLVSPGHLPLCVHPDGANVDPLYHHAITSSHPGHVFELRPSVYDPTGDFDRLRAAHDDLVAFHLRTVEVMASYCRLQHAIRERVAVVAVALPQSPMPPIGGALTIGERTAFEEGWDAALRFASGFVQDALGRDL